MSIVTDIFTTVATIVLGLVVLYLWWWVFKSWIVGAFRAPMEYKNGMQEAVEYDDNDE